MDRLRIVAFKGVSCLPIWLAQARGEFAREGLEVALGYTPSSTAQIEGMMRGAWEIGHTALDNIVAHVERSEYDLFACMGGDDGFLTLVGRPEIRGYGDLRGRELAVDALTTGFAFVLRRMLADRGLQQEDYGLVSVGATHLRYEALRAGQRFAATLLHAPFDLLAEQAGCRRLGAARDHLPHYQAVVGMARRPWARAHPDLLVRYIRAYLGALRQAFEPEAREEVAQVLALAQEIPVTLARQVLARVLAPGSGLSPDGGIDEAGVEAVLQLRAEMGGMPAPLPGPDKYVDLQYYLQARSAEG